MVRLEDIKIDMIDSPSSFWDFTLRPIKPFQIERKERRICFGGPGYVDDWVYVGGYDSKEERDKELDRLKRTSYYSRYELNEYRSVDNQPYWMETTWQN